MVGHIKVGQIWEATEGLQVDQRFVHLNELCSDSFFWNAQNPRSCMLWNSFRQVSLILDNPSVKQVLLYKQGKESKEYSRRPAFV